MEGISLRTPPPPWIFHFCRELMALPPLQNFHKCDKDPPNPSGKVHFHEERLLKYKNEAIYGKYATVSIISLLYMLLIPFI